MLGRELAGRHLTRKELLPLLPATGHPRHNEVVTHLLLIAEAVGLVCSGTPRPDGERWAKLTKTESLAALSDGGYATAEVGDVPLWFVADARLADVRDTGRVSPGRRVTPGTPTTSTQLRRAVGW